MQHLSSLKNPYEKEHNVGPVRLWLTLLKSCLTMTHRTTRVPGPLQHLRRVQRTPRGGVDFGKARLLWGQRKPSGSLFLSQHNVLNGGELEGWSPFTPVVKHEGQRG
uniref:Uncharacterized protein n=1 Tax=Sphaerodactylus townsendi TaxID=933632 RepID=A0ACB8FXG8_9SAUR